MTRTVKYKYTCFNDCYQTGCPSHEMEMSYNTTSDTITLTTLGHKDKNGEWCNSKTETFDRNEIKALTEAWKELWDKI